MLHVLLLLLLMLAQYCFKLLLLKKQLLSLPWI